LCWLVCAACGAIDDRGAPLTVTVTGPGTVTSTPAGIDCGTGCSRSFGIGTVVTLTATPAPGAIFIGWSGETCSGTSTCVVDNTNVSVKSTIAVTATFSPHGSQLFTSSGTFMTPVGQSSVRVLVVGGGGGGTNGHQAGGGGGRVAAQTVDLTGMDSVAVTVGDAGLGAMAFDGNNNIVGNTPGGTSSFGTLVMATGGLTSTVVNGPGGDGGSGGGGSCNAGTPGGNGGTGGANGGACTYLGGMGQGDYTGLFAMFTMHVVTAGAGGAGGTSSHSGGGGGGGVVVDNAGPNGADGAAAFSAKGGRGYGGGGGGGGYDAAGTIRYAGGNGAPGVVYVEW
jgi:hypothetical protein